MSVHDTHEWTVKEQYFQQTKSPTNDPLVERGERGENETVG